MNRGARFTQPLKPAAYCGLMVVVGGDTASSHSHTCYRAIPWWVGKAGPLLREGARGAPGRTAHVPPHHSAPALEPLTAICGCTRTRRAKRRGAKKNLRTLNPRAGPPELEEGGTTLGCPRDNSHPGPSRLLRGDPEATCVSWTFPLRLLPVVGPASSSPDSRAIPQQPSMQPSMQASMPEGTASSGPKTGGSARW